MRWPTDGGVESKALLTLDEIEWYTGSRPDKDGRFAFPYEMGGKDGPTCLSGFL
jgi:hypothetical protein